jgi:purine-binding chemotaxis protein CheW
MNPALPASSPAHLNSQSQTDSQTHSQTHSQIEACKATVFKVADHWLALPATAILKVIPRSALAQEEIDSELVHWENCPLLWLDLHSFLIRSATNPAEIKPAGLTQCQYVVIAWSQTGDRCAIPVDALPTLLDIPLSDVQVLPPHYRQRIGSLAKHTIVLPHKGSVLTILLLDLQQVLNKKFYD